MYVCLDQTFFCKINFFIPGCFYRICSLWGLFIYFDRLKTFYHTYRFVFSWKIRHNCYIDQLDGLLSIYYKEAIHRLQTSTRPMPSYFFRGQNMAAVHLVHQALTKCTSQQCCLVAEFTALFHECEGTENLLAVNRKLRSF